MAVKRSRLWGCLFLALFLPWWAMSPGWVAWTLKDEFIVDKDDFMTLQSLSVAYFDSDGSVIICGEARWVREIPRSRQFPVVLKLAPPATDVSAARVEVQSRYEFLERSAELVDGQGLCSEVEPPDAILSRHSRSGISSFSVYDDQLHMLETRRPSVRWGYGAVAVVTPEPVRVITYPHRYWRDGAVIDRGMLVEQQYATMYRLPRRVRPGDKRYYVLLPFAMMLDAILGPIPWFMPGQH